MNTRAEQLPDLAWGDSQAEDETMRDNGQKVHIGDGQRVKRVSESTYGGIDPRNDGVGYETRKEKQLRDVRF
jgi:hypothetical protein